MRREAANELPASTLEKERPLFVAAQENTSSGHAQKQHNNNNNYTATATQIDVINQWEWQLLCEGLGAEQAHFECLRMQRVCSCRWLFVEKFTR